MFFLPLGRLGADALRAPIPHDSGTGGARARREAGPRAQLFQKPPAAAGTPGEPEDLRRHPGKPCPRAPSLPSVLPFRLSPVGPGPSGAGGVLAPLAGSPQLTPAHAKPHGEEVFGTFQVNVRRFTEFQPLPVFSSRTGTCRVPVCPGGSGAVGLPGESAGSADCAMRLCQGWVPRGPRACDGSACPGSGSACHIRGVKLRNPFPPKRHKHISS